jgi:hypothetical protein
MPPSAASSSRPPRTPTTNTQAGLPDEFTTPATRTAPTDPSVSDQEQANSTTPATPLSQASGASSSAGSKATRYRKRKRESADDALRRDPFYASLQERSDEELESLGKELLEEWQSAEKDVADLRNKFGAALGLFLEPEEAEAVLAQHPTVTADGVALRILRMS